MKLKLIAMVCIAFLFVLSVHASEAVPEPKLGVYTPGEAGAAGTPTKEDMDQWLKNWGELFGEETVRAASKDGRASIPLIYSNRRIKVNTMGGGAFEGSFITEYDCKGGDIRGLFTAPGEFAMVFFNWARYDHNCGFLAKGDLDLPPPLSFTFLNEVGLGSSTGTLAVDSPGVWFHESVNDNLVQDWVAGPGWGVNAAWDPSVTYDMVGSAANDWSLTYYGARTYPRPAHDGFQYEACLRKNSGDPLYNTGLYLNGDGTMDNCIVVGITAVDGYYSVFENSGGSVYALIPWTQYEPNLFVDDTNAAGENVFNMVKANVHDDGSIDIFINEQYVASTQALYNFSGYVGLAIYDSAAADNVSCDNMTLSTMPVSKESIAGRKVNQGVRIADPMQAVSPR